LSNGTTEKKWIENGSRTEKGKRMVAIDKIFTVDRKASILVWNQTAECLLDCNDQEIMEQKKPSLPQLTLRELLEL